MKNRIDKSKAVEGLKAKPQESIREEVRRERATLRRSIKAGTETVLGANILREEAWEGGSLTTSDYGIGTLIGTYTGLSSLGFGQQALLDITSFVQSVQTPYFGILLTPADYTGEFGDSFSSATAYVPGDEPSGIVATPEPSAYAMLLGGLVLLLGGRRRLA